MFLGISSLDITALILRMPAINETCLSWSRARWDVDSSVWCLLPCQAFTRLSPDLTQETRITKLLYHLLVTWLFKIVYKSISQIQKAFIPLVLLEGVKICICPLLRIGRATNRHRNHIEGSFLSPSEKASLGPLYLLELYQAIMFPARCLRATAVNCRTKLHLPWDPPPIGRPTARPTVAKPSLATVHDIKWLSSLVSFI